MWLLFAGLGSGGWWECAFVGFAPLQQHILLETTTDKILSCHCGHYHQVALLDAWLFFNMMWGGQGDVLGLAPLSSNIMEKVCLLSCGWLWETSWTNTITPLKNPASSGRPSLYYLMFLNVMKQPPVFGGLLPESWNECHWALLFRLVRPSAMGIEPGETACTSQPHDATVSVRIYNSNKSKVIGRDLLNK